MLSRLKVFIFFLIIFLVPSVCSAVNFQYNISEGASPLAVQFTDLTDPQGLVNWSFGDGTYSNDHNPVHIYTTGQYDVVLVSTINGTSESMVVNGAISVGIEHISTADFSNVINGRTVQFTDMSVCNPLCTSWDWDFDVNGLSDSHLENPVYTYSSNGSYDAKLIVGNGYTYGTKIRGLTIGDPFVYTPLPAPTGTFSPTYKGGTFQSNTNIDLANSTFLKYWLQNFSSTGNLSVYGFAFGIMAPSMHVFGFWIYLIIWGLYLFAVWIRSQDVTLPLIIGILTIGVFGLLFPKESLPVILIMFAICGAIIIAKLMKDSI